MNGKLTKDEARHWGQMLLAAASGETLQRRTILGTWADIERDRIPRDFLVIEPQSWVHFIDPSNVRIKPKPREWWAANGLLFDTEDKAREVAIRCGHSAIHVREVTDE